MKIPLNLLRYRYRSLRPTLVQPLAWALFFLTPALDLFRFDVLAQTLVFLGRAYPYELRYMVWVPLTFFGGVLLIALTSWLCGRLFCGWACPHNAMTEWTRPLRALVGREAMPAQFSRWLRRWPTLRPVATWLSPLVSLGWTFGMSTLLAAYFVPLSWQVQQYASGTPHVALVFGHGLFTLIGLFLLYCGHDFCRTCCPYGMAQSVSAYQSGKLRPMEPRFTGASVVETCGGCTACQQVCPVDIDPRGPGVLAVGQFQGCFNCGECIDACKTVQSYRGRPGWLQFETPWGRALKKGASQA